MPLPKSLLIAFLLALLLGVAQQSALAPTAAAPVGTVRLVLDCRARPERTTLINNTTEGLALTGWTLGSLVRPRGYEPFAPSGRLEASAAITYLTGPDAIPGHTPLAENNIYDNEDPLRTPPALMTPGTWPGAKHTSSTGASSAQRL